MSSDEPTTERLRSTFAERAEKEAERAEEAAEPAAKRAHSRRADKAQYLEEKLSEQAEADRE
jgi:hypothetical protein